MCLKNSIFHTQKKNLDVVFDLLEDPRQLSHTPDIEFSDSACTVRYKTHPKDKKKDYAVKIIAHKIMTYDAFAGMMDAMYTRDIFLKNMKFYTAQEGFISLLHFFESAENMQSGRKIFSLKHAVTFDMMERTKQDMPLINDLLSYRADTHTSPLYSLKISAAMQTTRADLQSLVDAMKPGLTFRT